MGTTFVVPMWLLVIGLINVFKTVSGKSFSQKVQFSIGQLFPTTTTSDHT
jgi:hypothetical protein